MLPGDAFHRPGGQRGGRFRMHDNLCDVALQPLAAGRVGGARQPERVHFVADRMPRLKAAAELVGRDIDVNQRLPFAGGQRLREPQRGQLAAIRIRMGQNIIGQFLLGRLHDEILIKGEAAPGSLGFPSRANASEQEAAKKQYREILPGHNGCAPSQSESGPSKANVVIQSPRRVNLDWVTMHCDPS